MTLARMKLIGSSNEYIYPLVDSQRTVNMYVHSDKDSLLPVLVDMPGYQEVVEIAVSAVGRKLYTKFNTNLLYGVIGDRVYVFDAALTPTLLGTIGTITGNVSIAYNNSQEIMFVDGAAGYIYDEGATSFTQIVTPGFPASPEYVVYIDGYFIVNKGGTNEFYVSALNDGTAWDVLRFASITEKPDRVIGLGTVHRQLFVFGDISTEIWYNAGGSDFPFRRQNNLILPYGCAAPASIATGENRLIWLSKNENGVGSVVMTDGTLPISVSTRNVDIQIQLYDDVSDAVGYIYKIDGHIFYELSFTAANHTWCYDITDNSWSEREYIGENRYKVQTHAFYGNKHYVLLYDESNLHELSSAYITHDSEVFRRERSGIRIKDPYNRRLIVNEIGISFLQGVGELNTYYDDPKIFLSISEDGGVTFGNQMEGLLGATGERTTRTEWKNLGIFNDLVIKIEFFAPVRFIILDSYIDYTVCES